MRIAVFAVVLCLLVSPAAYADGQMMIEVEINSFLSDLWEVLIAIPKVADKAPDNDTATSTDGTNTQIEPPEGDAGPMVIVNG